MLRYAAILLLLIVSQAQLSAQILTNYTWLGTGTTNNFSEGANWGGNPIVSGQNIVAYFGGNTGASTSVTTATIDAAVSTSGTPAAFELTQLRFGLFQVPYSIGLGSGAPAVRFIAPNTGSVDAIQVDAGRTVADVLNFPITTGNTGAHRWNNFGSGGLTVNGSVTIGLTGGFSIAGTGNTTINGAVSLGISSLLNNSSGNLTINAVISSVPGANGISHNGTGTMTLSGANTYNGLTTIGNTGTLQLSGGANRLPANNSVQFNSTGTLDLNGNDQQISRFIFSGTASSNTRVVNSSATAATLTMNNPLNSTMTATLGNTGGNNFGLTYTPTGTQTLTFNTAHTYTGTTTINRGTIALSGSGSIANSQRIEVAAAGNFRVTGLTGGLSYDTGAARFLVKANQTLSGSGIVFGNVYVGPGSTLQAGSSSASDSLRLDGNVRIWGGGLTAGPSKLRVYAQDSTSARSSFIDVRTPDGIGTPSQLDLFLSAGAPWQLELIDTGTLVLGRAYSMKIASAPIITRNDVTISSAGDTNTFTFNAAEYALSSPTLTFSNVSLTASNGEIFLNYTPIPEPFAVLAASVLGLGFLRRLTR